MIIKYTFSKRNTEKYKQTIVQFGITTPYAATFADVVVHGEHYNQAAADALAEILKSHDYVKYIGIIDISLNANNITINCSLEDFNHIPKITSSDENIEVTVEWQ